MSALGADGRRFDPCLPDQNLFLGSTMVVHLTVNQRVVGSSPTRGANFAAIAQW